MLALTHYADMGLPTSVAIVTEGNTETTAEVAWDTTSPASGSYNPAVLTEQSVTLNGTVTCPSNIDQNGVTLTTTIPVTGTDGALDKLTGIYVDDKLVDAANYTLQSGSTILTFNASYLTICIIVMAIPNAC